MAEKGKEVIQIDDSCTSPDRKINPSRPILSLKERDQIKKYEEKEDCFILEFDPYDDIDISKLSLADDSDSAGAADLCVVADKGLVACRDYPHPRHICAEYPFQKTPHYRHCKQCYCYVCDCAAPCKMWDGASGHCHAFDSAGWKKKENFQEYEEKKTE